MFYIDGVGIPFTLVDGRMFVSDETIENDNNIRDLVVNQPELFEEGPWNMDGLFIKEELKKKLVIDFGSYGR